MVNGGNSGAFQTAYQIRVGHAPVLLEKHADCWDSGRVDSSLSINVPFAGIPLVTGKRYNWTVRTWHGGDTPSPWASPQNFTVAPPDDALPKTKEDSGEVSVYPLETIAVPPAHMEQKAGGRWSLDFGRQAFGWLELDMESSTDDTVVCVHLGEAWREGALDRNPPGSVRYAQSRVTVKAGRHRYRIQTPVDARNTGPHAIHLPATLGVVLPFRYAEIEVETGSGQNPPLLHGAFLQRIEYPFDPAASAFHSSHGTLNAVWDLCHYTIRATTFSGYYVDGDRERIPYEADAYINQLSHYAVDREFSLARLTHEYLLSHSTWPTEWKQHSILMAWADYEATGDDRSLRRHYGTLKNEKLLLEHARADGLLATGRLRDPAGRTDVGDLVDWPLVERDGFDFRDVNTVINAFHHRTLVLMSRIAAVLGMMDDARAFSARAETVLTRFNECLFDKIRGVYVDGEGSEHVSQHGNLFPLAFGLVPPERKASVVAYLKSRGMACSVYPAQYLLEGLFDAREAEHAIGLMTGGGLRSWKNMLDQGATLTWEAWDQSLKPNQDWNHAWAAAPANIIARYVLGVRPLEPGYGRVLIDPQLGNLREVSGIVPTIRGPIHVHAWRDDDGRLHCDSRAPANVEIQTG
jgi:alpha-L-rhamnosidase